MQVAGFVVARARGASGRFSLCLSGGSTPKRVYELLGDWRAPLDWQKVHLFWGDERFLPPDHQDSNFRMAHEALIDHVPIPAAQVHPIPTSPGSPEEAAALYAATLQGFYGSKTLDPERRTALLQRFNAILTAEQPVAFLVHPLTALLVHKRFEDAEVGVLGLIPERWWVKPENQSHDLLGRFMRR